MIVRQWGRRGIANGNERFTSNGEALKMTNELKTHGNSFAPTGEDFANGGEGPLSVGSLRTVCRWRRTHAYGFASIGNVFANEGKVSPVEVNTWQALPR
ncbi:hypothetical protein R1flu_026924 [Riccia fluitans]|uniref:Uncharacterized protein n=1 Tax=Riccia fluitans TaxID=41844 RepID=A0ABD1XKD0_9MARC